MNFSELVSEVLLIVKRPDLQTRIESAVRAATLKMHQSDFFYPDLVEVPVQFNTPANLQNFLPTDVVPNFRKVKYIRMWHGDVDGSPGIFLKPIQIENSLDGYGYTKENVFYMAGQLLQLRSSDSIQRVLFGCYVHPIVTPVTSYKSWIAESYPYAIIYEAARTIFRSISYQEQANEYAGLTAEILREIQISSVDDIPVT